MSVGGPPAEERVLILAPRGRDAEVAARLLARAGLACAACATMDGLAREIERGAGAALVTQEALAGAPDGPLAAWLDGQPPWSDFPFVVLAAPGGRGRAAGADAAIDALRNAIVLARPLDADAIVRAARSALAARRRQYEARDRLEALRRGEDALRASEAQFHAIVDSIDQMVWSTRPDGHHDFYNDRWHAFTGTAPGTTDGEGWNDLFHPDDRERAFETWRRSLATGEPYRIEYRLRHHTGAHRWVLGRAQPTRGPDGAIARWYGTCTDIDDQVRARETLARSREELERLVALRTEELSELYNKAPAILHALDDRFRITSVSDRWLHFTGVADRAEVIGRDVRDFARTHDAATPDAARDRRVGEAGTLDGIPCTWHHADGRRSEVLLSARDLRSPDGALIGTLVAAEDVTDRLRAEAARDEAETALRQSQKLEMIGQLTGGVAHDFNNLLMAIRSSLELLARRLPEGDARAADLLGNALKGAERGASLTGRMLAFARRQDLSLGAVDAGAMLEGMRTLIGRSVGPGVEVEIAVARAVPPALADLNQLEMAVLNLAINARDAMEGAGRLRLSVDADADADALGLPPGAYVRLRVADDGAGMSPETLARATEPFFTTKEVGRGTGLGLPMVHGLARQSGGTFVLESAPGAGTTATVVLPVAEAARAEEAPVAAPAPSAPPRTLRVLTVDDDVLVLMGTVGMLEDLGHEVLEAPSGRKALEIVDAGAAIDLVITDQAMPGMTGVELAGELRRRLPSLPVILASGYADLDEGACEVVSARMAKPFGEADLRRALEALTSGADDGRREPERGAAAAGGGRA